MSFSHQEQVLDHDLNVSMTPTDEVTLRGLRERDEASDPRILSAEPHYLGTARDPCLTNFERRIVGLVQHEVVHTDTYIY